MPLIVWVGAGIAGALVLNSAGEAIEDTSNAALKFAGAAAVGAGAYWLYRRAGR